MFDFYHIYAESAWNISTLDITNVHFADETMNNPSASKAPFSIKHFKKAAFRLGRQPCVDQEYTISFRTISSVFLAITLRRGPDSRREAGRRHTSNRPGELAHLGRFDGWLRDVHLLFRSFINRRTLLGVNDCYVRRVGSRGQCPRAGGSAAEAPDVTHRHAKEPPQKGAQCRYFPKTSHSMSAGNAEGSSLFCSRSSRIHVTLCAPSGMNWRSPVFCRAKATSAPSLSTAWPPTQ